MRTRELVLSSSLLSSPATVVAEAVRSIPALVATRAHSYTLLYTLPTFLLVLVDQLADELIDDALIADYATFAFRTLEGA